MPDDEVDRGGHDEDRSVVATALVVEEEGEADYIDDPCQRVPTQQVVERQEEQEEDEKESTIEEHRSGAIVGE